MIWGFQRCWLFEENFPFSLKEVENIKRGLIVFGVKMIQLLFMVVCLEGMVAFLLMVKIGPLRELVMKCLDQVKMRKGTVLTIAGTISAILFSNFISIIKIQNKGAKIGTMTPMDQVLWRTNLLEATLMGITF